MAIMIPDSCPSKASEGEKNLFKPLNYELPDDYLVWYEPIIERKLPDFIILAPTFGLLIIEVKGWSINQIIETNNDDFRIRARGSDKIESQTSPIRQCLSYMHSLFDKLKAYSVLTQEKGEYEGKLVFPIGYGVVMSNITEKQAQDRDLYDLFPSPQVAYRDELLSWDGIGEKNLVKRLEKFFAVRFPFSALTNDQISTIKGIIHPEVVIRVEPAVINSVPKEQQILPNSSILVTLDSKQENLAKKIGDGHRLFYGVAGSGKTLILLSRAKLLATQSPNQKILILCYNMSLASHLRSTLRSDTLNLQFKTIEVLHFHAFAKHILGRLPNPKSVEGNYDEYMGELLLRALNLCSNAQKYDSICVDEAHTFFPNWFKCCVSALKDPKNGNLMIVSDGNQKLYKRSDFTWKSVGVEAKGRTISKDFNLDVNYRNTQEILSTAWNILGNTQENTKQDDNDTFPFVKPQLARRKGEKPILYIVPNQIAAVIKEVKNLQTKGYKSEEIAILYKSVWSDETSTMEALCNQLAPLGGAYWISRDRESKLNYNVMNRGVRIVTVLSSLGLEFKAVLILWVEKFAEAALSSDSEVRNLARRQLYVAMTRAQYVLCLFSSEDSQFIQELKNIESLEVIQN